MRARVFFQIGLREFEQGRRWPQMVFLQMHERAGQLYQSLVKRAVGPVAVFEPKLFQNIVRLVELPSIEAFKLTRIKRIEAAGRGVPDHARDSFCFAAHSAIVSANR